MNSNVKTQLIVVYHFFVKNLCYISNYLLAAFFALKGFNRLLLLPIVMTAMPWRLI